MPAYVIALIVAFGMIGMMFYYMYKTDEKERVRAREALKNPELTMQQLAEYDGWHASGVSASFMSEQQIAGVLRLSKKSPNPDPDSIYVHVPDIARQCTWYMLNIVRIEERAKEILERQRSSEKYEQEQKETLERIRRGESVLDRSTESSSSGSSSA